MNRKSFKLPFSASGTTKYTCPTCSKGYLKVIPGTLHRQESKHSLSGHSHDAWEPEWIEYVYSCLFECSNTVCKETIASAGIGSVTQYYGYDADGRTEINYEDFFTPKYFSPHLKLFDIPKDIPPEVENEINKSFDLIFSDAASSANHIRVALEHLLTHLGIKRFTIIKGKRNFLALHKRIELIPSKYNHIKDIIFAIKWLGNAGSHSNHEVTFDDVLDSYELMQELLEEMFNNSREKAKALAKVINKKKGPK